jgi:predicted RNA polymerase sigma factor
VILKDKAAVFVDGRYTLQVRDQVDGGLFEIRDLVDGGVPAYLEAAAARGSIGAYQLQAAIAAVHAEAARAEDTDWPQIETLYRMLEDLAPSPVITLNHAVAVAMVGGPAAGLAMLAPLLADPHMRRNHRLHAVRAHLLETDGRLDEARAAYAEAAKLATSIPEQRYLNSKARSPG